MRSRASLLAPLLFATLLACAPRLAGAQERGTPLVELQRVEARADAPRKSAFGRVMDVMIGALVQEHARKAGQRPNRIATRLAPEDATAAAGDGAPAAPEPEPRIEITLGERFALPVANATANQAGKPQASKP